ncbi:bromodomain-containing protein 7-like isoform X2 [Lytechinus variegatus]|uniref:bromodomain-containing protein 7-like isoform X2 n=1 Tax=Lytechinus variegatus TaxID=7654 RepID=UPI001BB176E8|nr:bromodomain-containing protein 7-like isoform X2 [Lytechinus variegatus]
MGKKHKKHHRSERKEIDDGMPDKSERSGEPPLRLVLKVGPENIMTASPSSDHFSAAADSPATPDTEYRHSHHKKKKKKKRNDHDRKRTSGHFDTSQSATPDPDTQEDDDYEVEGSEEGMEEGGWSEPPPSKKILLSLHERRANPSRHCKEEPPVPEKRPILKVLENLQKTLQRKDVDGFFAWPVNDIIAPGYSSIILHPMDFSTMKKKMEREDYNSIDEYKADFVLMCENAMKYNRPETVYFKAAKKLLSTGQRVMSKERLATIKRAFGCVDEGEGRSKPRSKPKPSQKLHAEVESMPLPELMDTNTMDTMVTDDASTTNQTDVTGKSEDEDDMDEDDAKILIQEVLEAAKAAKDRLTARKPNSKFGFLRKDKAGTTTLSVLNPDRGENEENRKVNLGLLTGRLSHGTASLPGFKEDKRNKALPVSYLMYGPFSSFAPGYDSTFANLSKEESDLIYSTYGDEEGVKYAKSIQEYVKDSGDHVTKMVDNLLDSLTNGEHSKTKEQIRQNQELKEFQAGLGEPGSQLTDGASGGLTSTQGVKIDFESLKSLADEGIDMSFLPALEKEMAVMDKIQSETEKEVDQKLGKTAELIRDLERSQNERLNRKPPPHLQYIQGPSDQEHAIAEQLTQQLKELTAKTLPGHLAQTESVRKAMGITMEPLFDSPPPSIATSQTAPSETTEGSSALPDDNALPDDIAKELEADETGTTGDEEGKGDDDVDAEVGDELLELLRDKDGGS